MSNLNAKKKSNLVDAVTATPKIYSDAQLAQKRAEKAFEASAAASHAAASRNAEKLGGETFVSDAPKAEAPIAEAKATASVSKAEAAPIAEPKPVEPKPETPFEKAEQAKDEEAKLVDEELFKKTPKTLLEEEAEMPEWEKKELSKITYDHSLVENNVILSVRHLKKFFTLGTGFNKAKLKAVHDVSFDVKKGEVFGIVGESGCGKTTTGRTIMRLHMPTSGSVYFKGYRISAGNRWNEKEIKWTKIRGREAIKKIKDKMSDQISEMSNVTDDDKEAIAEVKAKYQAQIHEIEAKIKATNDVQKAKIRRHNYDNKHIDIHLLTKMQMIFQDPIDSLDPRMTVEQTIEEGLKIQNYGEAEGVRLKKEWDAQIANVQGSRLSEAEKKAKLEALSKEFTERIAAAKDYRTMVADALNKVGLLPEYASRFPHEFSGGQRQRIGIARALVMHPELIIADEPISALDVSIRAQIINLLNDLRDEMGLTIIFIAHDLSVVKYFCERIAVMYFGNLVELATSDELFKHPLHPYTKSLLSAIPKPDPLSEKVRTRIRYNPSKDHDYSKQQPTFREIVPGHFVLCNDEEAERYLKEIKQDDIINAKKAAEEEAIEAEVALEEKEGK